MTEKLKPPVWRPWSAVSGSQVAGFDVAKAPKEACERRWALRYVFGRKAPEKAAQRLGIDIHAEVEAYYLKGESITSVIALAGINYWPAPSQFLRVEQWFAVEVPGWPDDRQKFVADTGWPSGYGRFSGRSDLLDMSGRVPVVIDFKNLASLNSAKKPEALADSPPMIGYAQWALTHAPAADSVVLKLIVNETRIKCKSCKQNVRAERICGNCAAPLNLPRAKEVRAELSRADVHERWIETVETVHRMRRLSVIKDWREFKANKQACYAFGGCPHRDLCYGTAALLDRGISNEELESMPSVFNVIDAAAGRNPWRKEPERGNEMLSPDISGLFIGLSRMNAQAMPDADTCKAYVDALKGAGFLPGALPLLPDAVAVRAQVVLMMSNLRSRLIGILSEALTAGNDPDESMIGILRPLQVLYATLVQAEQQHKLNEEQTAMLRSMQHPQEDAVMAALRDRKKKTVQAAPPPPPPPRMAPRDSAWGQAQGPISEAIQRDEEFAALPLNGLLCSVCGMPQRISPSGTLCANGHGGADGNPPPQPPPVVDAPLNQSKIVARGVAIMQPVEPQAEPQPQPQPQQPQPQQPQPGMNLAAVIRYYTQALEKERGKQGTPEYHGGAAARAVALILGEVQPQTDTEQAIARISAVTGIKAPGLWIFIDCRALKMSDDVISGRPVIEGNAYVQTFKEQVAAEYWDAQRKRKGVAHYKEIGYGAGPLSVVTAARNALLLTGPAIIYLDSQDEVQAELARSLMSVAEVYVRISR